MGADESRIFSTFLKRENPARNVPASDSGRVAFTPSDGGSLEFIVTVIRASISSNLVLPRQLVLPQQVVLLILSLVLTRKLELVTHIFRVGSTARSRDVRFAQVLANLHCQTTAVPLLSPWITCSQHLWSKGNAGQIFPWTCLAACRRRHTENSERSFRTSWFFLELTNLLVITMVMDEAAIAESLSVGCSGRSPNSPLEGESTPVAPLTGNTASGATAALTFLVL